MQTTLRMMCLALAAAIGAVAGPETDVLPGPGGDLKITFIGHGTLVFAFSNTVVHVDPWGKLTDYARQPKADILLVTHAHPDHLDTAAIAAIRTPATAVVLAPAAAGKVEGGGVMTNGAVQELKGIRIEAVPAYNLVHMRPGDGPYHPRGEGNGYLLSFGALRVYVAGDTENTPEMKALKAIDIAFLPMNLPYTMTPEMVADAARAMRPKILYPYHYGETDLARLTDLLKDVPEIEVRIRKMQ